MEVNPKHCFSEEPQLFNNIFNALLQFYSKKDPTEFSGGSQKFKV